jgi:hypothetical protein
MPNADRVGRRPSVGVKRKEYVRGEEFDPKGTAVSGQARSFPISEA